MATTDILPFAGGGSANVISQSAYVALTTLRANGFVSGTALSNEVNKVVRQSSFMAAGLASFCVAQGVSIPDDADLSGLVTNITNALKVLLLARANNLSDVASVSAARTNLGLGSAATQATTAFLQVANNLSDLASASAARTSLGLGSAALQPTSAFDAAGAAAAVLATSVQKSANLSDLASASTARTNLGLGSAATQAATFFLQTAANLSDVPNKATARTNLGLGTAATQPSTAFDASGAAAAVQALACLQSANLSDINNAATARGNLGLGTAATHPATDFDTSGAAATAQSNAIAASLQKSQNLNDVPNPATARTNLGLGTAATQPSTAFDPAGSAALRLLISQNLNDVPNPAAARTNLGLGTAATHATADFDTAGAAASALATAKAYADAEGFGPSISQVPVIRSTGVNYTNTSRTAIYVSSIGTVTADGSNFALIVDGVTQIAQGAQNGQLLGVGGFVPPGSVYSFTMTSGSIGSRSTTLCG